MSHDAPSVLGRSAPRTLTAIVAMSASAAMVGVHIAEVLRTRWEVWHLVLLPLAWIAADLVSGVVHWTADTFGSEDTPLIGKRFIRPFRVHHENADDILSRSFLDLNGDVALGVIPILVTAFALPSAPRLFLFALALCLLPTNQIHQWAHRTVPPALVRGLQRARLILRPEEHRLHHTAPFRSHFCITTGWCNRYAPGVDFLLKIRRCGPATLQLLWLRLSERDQTVGRRAE